MANYGEYVKRTAGCPDFGDWAIANKLNIPWGKQKRGDLVLFDFNGNGTSDHIGIVTKVGDGYIETIEGNTGNGSNTNGDGVYRRKRYKSQVNYFVRPKCPNMEAVIKTAESQLGYKEGKNNNNKYGKWFGMNYVSWCCIFIVWLFYHTEESAPEKESYDGDYPVLSSPSKSVKFAKKQKGTYAWRGKDHHKYSNKFTKYFAGKYGIDEKGQFPRYKNDIAGDCDLFAFGYVLSNTDVPQTEIMKEMGSYRWWWSSNLYRWLKKNGKIVKTPKEGDVAFFSKGGKICTHICFVVKVNGNKITTMDKNGKFCKTYTRNKSLYLGFYRPDYNDRIEKGEKSENVKRLQAFLKWYGYDISVDGDFGDETESAVIDFKTKHKTGSANYVGLTTLAKMKELGK